MRAIKVGLAILVCVIISVFAQFALAHDGYWGDDTTPIDIDAIGQANELDLSDHYDADPWKGYGYLTVRNYCYEDWGDFHLRIKEVWDYGDWCNPTDVVFDVDTEPELWIKEYGSDTYVQVTDGLSWILGADGTTLDLFFYDDPIEQYDKALIKVYTDNTSWHRERFKICVYPTLVPEPATIALLGIGAIALVRRPKK